MKNFLRILSFLLLSLYSTGGLKADLVGSGVSKALSTQGSSGQIQSNSDTIDRRQNANQAGNKGDAGKAAAIAAGTVLTSIGAPMAASIDPIVRAAGINLLAKAAQEFAQAAATNNTKNQNNAQRDLLKMNVDDPSKQITGSGLETPRLTPEAAKALSDKGINPDQFMNQMANGDLIDPDEIRKIMGDNSTLSPEDQAKALTLENEKMGEAFSQLTPTESLALNENTKEGGSPNSAGNPANTVTLGGAPAADSNSFAAAQASDNTHVGAKIITRLPAEAGELKGDGEFTPATSSSIDRVLNSLGMGGALAKESESVRIGVAQNILGKIGVGVAIKGQNIFSKANRSYRSFGKWRKQSRF